MPSKEAKELTKSNIDVYLLEVAKEYRRLGGKKMPAEMIVVGGASIILNYSFRNMTTDIDAMLYAPSAMKEAINHVEDKMGLNRGWLNEDFKRTVSYSPALVRFSTYYKTFANVLEVRTVNAEYLIAMKLRSKRIYRNDRSDIVGILAEHEKNGGKLTLERIEKAYEDLYGKEPMSEDAHAFIAAFIGSPNLDKAYQELFKTEGETLELLSEFEKEHTGELNESNIEFIVTSLREKKGKSN